MDFSMRNFALVGPGKNSSPSASSYIHIVLCHNVTVFVYN